MARAWSGEDTVKAMDHFHKAILLLWKIKANSLATPEDLDTAAQYLREETVELHTVKSVHQLLTNPLLRGKQKETFNHLVQRNHEKLLETLVDAEHQLFELCLYHQDTSANVTVVTGTTCTRPSPLRLGLSARRR